MSQSGNDRDRPHSDGDPSIHESSERRVGRYLIGERLGVGGMGEVYQAWDPLLDRCVALKTVSIDSIPDRKQRRMLLEEARAASSLQHPSLVAIYDVLELEEGDFIVEELVVGTPLRECIREPFELGRFLAFAEQCCDALATASAKGIVHCDLKPENISVTPDGKPKILDFGIARRTTAGSRAFQGPESPTVTLQDVSPRGTPAYLPPELINGQRLDGRADLFSLGVVFYEMLTGKNPFRRDTIGATLTSILTETASPPSRLNEQVPAAIDRLILQMLEKDPSKRPVNAAEVTDRIRDLRRAHARRPVRRRSTRWRVAAAILVPIAVLVVGGILATSLFRQPRDGGPDMAGEVPCLVVRAFENLSSEPEMTYFSAGLLEVVETRLSKLKGLQVVDENSEIGGRYSLEGSLQRSGSRLRISYRILQHPGRIALEGDLVEGSIERIFDLQDEVTRGIAEDLKQSLQLGQLPEESGPPPTDDALAYQLYLQARGYLRSYENPENVEIAIGLFERAIEQDPDFALAHCGLADAYWKRWEETKDPVWPQRAERASRTALEIQPDFAEVHVTLGTILRGTGKPEQAVMEFERAIDTDPLNDAAYIGLALSQEAMGQEAAAIETFERAIAARPDYWASFSHLGAFHGRHGRWEEARRCFEEVVALTPKNARGYSNLGAAHLRLNDPEAAVEAFQKSLQIKPNHRAYSNIAYVQRSQGRMDEAAENFSNALVLNPDDSRLWGNLAATYQSLPGKEAEADSALRNAIRCAEPELAVNPNDAGLLARLSGYHSGLGEFDRARELIEQAVGLAPDQVDVLSRAALVFDALGDRERAREVIETALRSGLSAESIRQEPAFRSLITEEDLQKISDEIREGSSVSDH
ncbi:MAG: tetratricopeptide repeat protein [Candidatus Latescibacteria bacterium]|nr:tetratricopeptide repeat protein [Candidatus Latescibacterota bacterium]